MGHITSIAGESMSQARFIISYTGSILVRSQTDILILNGIKSAGTYKLSFRKKTEKRLKKKKRPVWYRTYTVLYWAVQALNQYTVQFTIVHVPVSCWTSKYHQYQTVLQTLVSSTSNHIHMVLSIGCNDLKNNNSNLSFIKVLSYK